MTKMMEEALAQPQFCLSMAEELQALVKSQTWELVPLPDKHAVGCCCVCTKKHNSDGYLYRYKASLVANGYTRKIEKICLSGQNEHALSLNCLICKL